MIITNDTDIFLSQRLVIGLNLNGLELKLFVNTDLKISATWNYTTNNGGFHNLKAEGISISF